MEDLFASDNNQTITNQTPVWSAVIRRCPNVIQQVIIDRQ
jgi:hypothetical protein